MRSQSRRQSGGFASRPWTGSAFPGRVANPTYKRTVVGEAQEDRSGSKPHLLACLTSDFEDVGEVVNATEDAAELSSTVDLDGSRDRGKMIFLAGARRC